ncbi:hypothetical protein ASG92_20490 [Arthrobacter sp. Soil736]|uniref:hypothetical protein n=1 Tax=Arthrobacter sp. Soil736 TaxID=1736395 RepID=UPI00070212E9|nr:hypothetical protein [Arthrobacter sp. Soil736]KRE61769.1 hypothetical protein ASG92_20490 [Arthrobacter sp. Soil736]
MVPEPVTASTHALAGVGATITPEQAWSLAPLIAGAPFYRPGRKIAGRFQYRRPARAPKITRALPKQPAAVMIHGTDGSVSTLCLDLDAPTSNQQSAATDAARLRALLTSCGIVFVEDFSPSGGRHLYIPLQERLDAAAARELVEAMGLIAQTLDPSPHQNITDGCIRVPGSVHKSGGHQTLITPLTEAYAILRRRNSATAVAALRRALAPQLDSIRALKARSAETVAAQRTGTLHLPTPTAHSTSFLREVAKTGSYPSKYKSHSEARMAVLNHFAGGGWTLERLQAAMPSQFPGLVSLYGDQSKQDRLLHTEWARAGAWTQKPSPKQPGEKDASINNTSPTNSQGGTSERSAAAIHQLANDLENVLYAVLDHRLKERGREGISLRLLIRGLLGYMRTRETDVLDVGCRTLAAALGKHHVTIARLLPVLVEASDGILTKVADAWHKGADVYLIQLPEHFQQLARQLTWHRGKIHAVRPVFRALGDVAALTYEAIERGRHSPTSAELIRSTGLSRSAVEKALYDMEALGMIHRDGRHWKTTATANLSALAERLGVMDDYRAQVSRNKRDRAAWHAFLERFTEARIEEADLYDAEQEEHWMPPDDQFSLWLAA